MGRVESFREIRLRKRKFKLFIILIIVLCISGILVTDFAFSQMITGNEHMRLIYWSSDGENGFEITVLHRTLHINKKYLKQDIERLKQFWK